MKQHDRNVLGCQCIVGRGAKVDQLVLRGGRCADPWYRHLAHGRTGVANDTATLCLHLWDNGLHRVERPQQIPLDTLAIVIGMTRNTWADRCIAAQKQIRDRAYGPR